MKPGKQSEFFAHTACEYFPCHPTEQPDAFNCLFCYCPLYTLGEDCGGDFTYTDAGVKSCQHCLLPHGRLGYETITRRFPELAARAARR